MRERFHRRLNDVLRPTAVPLDAMRPDELAAHYRDLERELLSRWDAPLVNDFLAMIFHGTLRKLCRKWCNDEGDGLANGLIAGMGGIISAEPAKRLEALAGQLRNDAEAIQILGEGSPAQILACLRVRPGLEAEVTAYLERFGDRCLEELKLETETLGDDPTLLHRTVARMAATPAKARTAEDPSAALLAEAEAKVDRALAGHGVRRFVFDWVLRLARERVRDRENLRFERTTSCWASSKAPPSPLG
jgi:pyruvate,water dikinase